MNELNELLLKFIEMGYIVNKHTNKGTYIIQDVVNEVFIQICKKENEYFIGEIDTNGLWQNKLVPIKEYL